ncbi:MAG: ATP-binding cassette domain-containing protein [Deltaproteobacteria bacterium]|nr:ATP-binding cassette domain-containing protein [Deltaproteobacteria bacterium]
MTEASCIRFEKVSVEVNGRRIVTDVDLAVRPGEKVAMLGPSGSGKTTLLRVIAGLEERIVEGRVEFLGQEASVVGRAVLPPHAREVAMLFQDLALWPHMSVREHLLFPIRRLGLARNEVAERVEQSIVSVSLSGREKAKPSELSGGEQQRLALARALVGRPSRLLLDEPFSSLDLPLKKEMIELVLELHERSGFTLVHVTHDPVEAARVADRVIALDSGEVIWSGPPQDLMQAKHPALEPLIRAADWWS